MLPTFRVSLKHPQPLLRFPKVLGFVSLLAILCACEKSSHDLLVEARGNLASASYERAVEDADAGLRASPSKADAWGLELVKLEAFARGGNGENAKRQLVKLAEAGGFSASVAYWWEAPGGRASTRTRTSRRLWFFPHERLRRRSPRQPIRTLGDPNPGRSVSRSGRRVHSERR